MANVQNDGESEDIDLLVDQFSDAVVFLEEAVDEEIARLRVLLLCRLGNREAIAESLVICHMN